MLLEIEDMMTHLQWCCIISIIAVLIKVLLIKVLKTNQFLCYKYVTWLKFTGFVEIRDYCRDKWHLRWCLIEFGGNWLLIVTFSISIPPSSIPQNYSRKRFSIKNILVKKFNLPQSLLIFRLAKQESKSVWQNLVSGFDPSDSWYLILIE